MYVPKALFTKDNLPPKKEEPKTSVATKDFVGKFTVSDSGGKVVFETPIPPVKKAPGSFVPPVQRPKPVQEEKKKPDGPAPLFKPNGNVESEVTDADKLRYAGFTAREIVKIKDASETIDLTDRVSVLHYGQDLNKKLAQAVDDILEFAKTNTFNSAVSNDVSKLQRLINFNPSQDPDEGFFSVFKKKKTVEERINDVISEIENVVNSIDKNIKFFIDMIPKIDDLLDRSKNYHSDLIVAIAAGKDRITVFKRRKMSKLEEQLQGGNTMIAQNARDELDIFNSFVKRIETLELTVGQNELTLAQIRLTQSTNVKMVENLNNMMTSLIPLWKQSLISAISSNNFDGVQKNKDLLSQSISDIMSVKSAVTA